MEDLPAETREAIEPFYNPDPRASNDLLNEVQRAFVKYTVRRALSNRESLNMILAMQIIKEGVDANIWLEDFQPSEAEDFDRYLLNRIKNERKTLKRASLLETQNDALASYMVNKELGSEIQDV